MFARDRLGKAGIGQSVAALSRLRKEGIGEYSLYGNGLEKEGGGYRTVVIVCGRLGKKGIDQYLCSLVE